MPIVLKKSTNDYTLAVWKVTESIETLYTLLPKPQYTLAEIEQRFKASHRRMEFIAVRVLLASILDTDAVIEYLPSGHPKLQTGQPNISISHTADYVAILLSTNRNVGVDIECVSDRAYKLHQRFTSPNECVTDTWSALLHWSAKETVYKIIDLPAVDFQQHLQIVPFTLPTPSIPTEEAYDDKDGTLKSIAEGSLSLLANIHNTKKNFCVHYSIFPDFVLTYAFD
jgi:4'-phosphopantetheinyl transferase